MNRILLPLLFVFAILFNNVHAQQFEPASRITGKTVGASGFAHGDIDGDGDEDLLIGHEGSLMWIENDGTGDYIKSNIISYTDLELYPRVIEVADVNGDSFADVLIVSNESVSRLLLFLNDGTGEFADPVQVMTSVDLKLFKLGDLDGDLDLDLIATLEDPSNDIRIYENDGAGVFSQVLSLNNVGTGLENIAIGDLGGSALPDILACSIADDKLVWYENTGSFSFNAQTLISTDLNYPRRIGIADLDGDNLNEVICSSYLDENLAWFQNTGSGTFGAPNFMISADNEPMFITVDIDDDGDVDLLTNTGTDEVMEFYENDGEANFAAPVQISQYMSFWFLTAFDVDNDGDLDPVYDGFFNQPDRGSLRVVPNDANTGFLPEESLTVGLNKCLALDHADLDGDGWEDVLSISSSDNKVYWSRNLTNGAFEPAIILSDSVNNVQSVLATDIDQDGDMDVLAVERGYGNTITNNRVHVYENAGNGEFTLGTMLSYSFPGGTPDYSFVFAEDVTGNSFPEVFAISYDPGSGSERIYKWDNYGDWSFSSRITVANVAIVQSIEFADLDGVNGKDMIYTSGTWASTDLAIRLNDGTGNFPDLIDVSLGDFDLSAFSTGETLTPADMDGDGDQDIVMSMRVGYNNYDQSAMRLFYLENDGNAEFTSATIIEDVYALCFDIEVGDMDGDEDMDVVGVDIYGASWWRNNGGGDYTRFVVDSISEGQITSAESITNRSLKLADMDNDGDLDVLHSNAIESYNGQQVKLSRNELINCAIVPSLVTNELPVICSGNSITLTAAGGNSFTWNNGLTNQAEHTVSPEETTTYSVTITDGESCTVTESLTVTVLQGSSTSIETSACDSYTAPDGNVYTESGEYIAVLTDENGCDSTFTISLTIGDNIQPIPDADELENIMSECPIEGLTAPTASDNCAGALTGTSDATFPISESTMVTWTYEDGNGNTSFQTQEIIIEDSTAPVADTETLEDVVAECELTALIAPTATDNCEGEILGTHNATFPITTSTTITWSYEDGSGNTSTQNQEIMISDISAPVADMETLDDVISECEVTALIAPTATDNCEGEILGTHNATFPITANTTITWSYEDGSGNTLTQTQEIIINEINNGIMETEPGTLTADADGYDYQWVDCNNGNEPITDETEQNFVASTSGNFAVEVSNGTCSVTSDCVNVIIIGVEEEELDGIEIYPNPSNGLINISSINGVDRVVILNALGQKLKDLPANQKLNLQLQLPDENGVYLIRIETNGLVQTSKVIRQ